MLNSDNSSGSVFRRWHDVRLVDLDGSGVGGTILEGIPSKTEGGWTGRHFPYLERYFSKLSGQCLLQITVSLPTKY